MDDRPSDFRATLDAIRAGSPDAVRRLIDVYGPHLQRVIRRRLDQRLRSKFDSIDFMQMVWASFFHSPGDLSQLREPNDLIRYLCSVARHKLISEHRRRIGTDKYDVQREQSLHETPWEQRRVQGGPPSPSQLAIARERWERLTLDRPARERQILELRARGVTCVEIGQQLGIHERTVRAVIERLRRSS